MEQLLPLFEKAEATGGMNRDIQQEIFHYLASRYSCIPLVGTKGLNAKKPKPDMTGWNKCRKEELVLRDFDTDMIGLCNPPFNQLFFLDVDDVNIFQQVSCYFNLSIPDTTIVKTGKGFHYYYLYPNDGAEYKDKSKIYLGFDIRASSYVVAPGSSHPNGSYYKVIKSVNPLNETPEWLKCIASNTGEINFILSRLNTIRQQEVVLANNHHLPIPTFELDNLISKFLEQYPNYEHILNHFSANNNSVEITMNHINRRNPFEIDQNPVNELPQSTQDLLNQSPPVKYRSEPTMAGITTLLNAGLTCEQTKQIMLAAPLGDKLRQNGEQFTNREIASAYNFIQSNPPKKPKINIETETYNLMLQQHYVQDYEGKLYCKVIQSNSRVEYIDVKSDSFYGIICKQLLVNFKRSIVPTKFKPLLTVLIEEKRLIAPTVPTVNRFYQDDKRLIYDLGRDDYQCVEISSGGFKIIPHPEMILERSVLTLSVQDIDISQNTTDNINLFWDICEINSDYQRHYLNIIILSYLFDKISSPILYFYGQYGSGKTHLARSIKGIFDPWEAGSVIPTKIDNFRLLLNQSGIGFMDNFSELKRDILNDLCNSYTGGIAYSRQLFQDKKAIKYNIRCPMILTSINVPTKLPDDFVSRTVFIKVNPKRNRLPEMELNQKLNNLYPKIRGEIFNLASQVLPLLNTYKPTNLSRHADLDLLGQAYCDICKPPLSYIGICQQINIDSAFSVIEDEPSIRNFIKIVSERKFITFTMSEMSEIMFKDLNLDFRINEAQLGRDLKIYAMVLHQLHIKLYYGERLSSGAKPCVAFLDDGNSIPEDIDSSKLGYSPQYVTEIYLRSHKTEIGHVLDEMINRS